MAPIIADLSQVCDRLAIFSGKAEFWPLKMVETGLRNGRAHTPSSFNSGNFSCRKSTIGTTIVAIEGNNDTCYLQNDRKVTAEQSLIGLNSFSEALFSP